MPEPIKKEFACEFLYLLIGFDVRYRVFEFRFFFCFSFVDKTELKKVTMIHHILFRAK